MELWRSLCTEKYRPVSTAKRSPITRQKVIWYQGEKMSGTAGPNRRGRGIGKMTVVKTEIWNKQSCPYWGVFAKQPKPRPGADSYPRKSSVDRFICLPSQIKCWIGISQRMTSNTSVLQNIKKSYRRRRVLWLPEFSKCLTRLNLKVFFETGLLEAFGVHYEYKRGKEYVVCSALIWPQNLSFWKGSQRVMWLGNSLWATLNSGIHRWHQHIFTHHLLWT